MFEYCKVRVSEVGSPARLVQEVEAVAEAVGRDDIDGKVAVCAGQVEGRPITSLCHDFVTEQLDECGNLFFNLHDDCPREELGNRRSSDAVVVVVCRAKFSFGASIPQNGVSGCEISRSTVKEDKYTDTAAELI